MTPVDLVKFIYGFLELQGFKSREILEPAVGHGVFIDHMPEEMKKNCHITAVEIDQISSQIVKTLYPDVTLYTQGFETFNPEKRFDAIIGNPPYSSQTLTDEQHPDLKGFYVHHYLVAKCMRLLKAGGLLAMVLPSFFMDNVRDHPRHIIAQEGGSLLAAYRLPDDLFSDAKVTIDLVFLKKGKTGNKWLYTITIGDQRKPLNDYYHTYPQHILGNLEIVPMYERTGLTCKRIGNPFSLLAHALHSLKQEYCALLLEQLTQTKQKAIVLQGDKNDLMKKIQATLFTRVI